MTKPEPLPEPLRHESVAPQRRRARRFLREPLLHFLLLGMALLGAQRLRKTPAREGAAIVLSAAEVEGLRSELARRSGQSPTEASLQAALQNHLNEEVLYREALRQGLDRGDVIVRRRLIQKMEFVTEALAAAMLTPPTDAELTAYLAAHPESFRTVPRFSLLQVFVRSSAAEVAPPKQGIMEGNGKEGLQKISPFQRAEALRLQLQAGAEPTRLGDPLLQSPQLTLQSQSELARSFGSEFASAVAALPLQTWSAPIPSSFGVHVVQVTQREEGRPALLSEVRAQVQELLLQEQRLAKKQQVLSQLRAQYQVHVDSVSPTQLQPLLATPKSPR